MKITSILPREAMIASLSSRTRDQVLRELAHILSTVDPNLKEEEVWAVLCEREKLGSTGIGGGIAIPHGKLASAKHILACFGRSIEGIDFQSQDGEPTHLFFALIAPENAAGLHLKVLAKLSRLLKDKSFRENLYHAENADEIFQIFLKEDEK